MTLFRYSRVAVFSFLLTLVLPALSSFSSFSSFSVVPSALAAEDKFLTIATGGITGVYYPVGGAICALINETRKEHGFRCTAESTEASVYNVGAIRSGEVSMGIVQSDIQQYAATGKGHERFAAIGPDSKLRTLFSLYSEAFTVIARADAKINRFSDLKGKRVTVGPKGSGSRNTTELLLKEFGWNPDTFATISEHLPAAMAGELCANAIDAYIYVIGHPNGSIQEASMTCDSVVASVAGPEVDSFLRKYPYYTPATIPGGIYKGTNADTPTFGLRATLVASSDLSEEAAYQLVKTVFSNLEQFKTMHPALSGLTAKQMLIGNTAPLHPGAIRYFKEAGLM